MINQYLSFLTNKESQAWAEKVAAVFSKFPHLPKKVISFLVKILPYLILFAGVGMLISAWQNLFAFKRVHQWLSYWGGFKRSYYYINAFFELVLGLVYLGAWKHLKEKKYEGWMLIFWTTIISTVQNLVFLFLGWSSFFSLALGTAISFWLLYELRPHYLRVVKKEASKSKKVTKKSTTKKK